MGLADFVLILHFCCVLFIVGGLVLVWIGAWLDWRWVRNFLFRAAHLAAILFVAGESLLGMTCPLTVWEDALRAVGTPSSFMQRWVGRLIYFDFPEWVFTLAYLLFAITVVVTFIKVKPARP